MSKIEKPTEQTKAYFDYFDCKEYIEQKLGYDIDDKARYWHFIVKACDVSNGIQTELPDEDQGTEAQQLVTKAFNEEFGEDAIYEIDW